MVDMKLNNLFDNNDMFLEITSYLNFEDKIVLSKTIGKNCLHKYNFNDRNFRYQNIDDVFSFYNEENDDEISDYICELTSDFASELDKYYDEYYGYNAEDYMDDCYNNLIYEKYRELTELFGDSYLTVYARKIAEYIEDKNLPVSYYKYDLVKLEEKLGIDINAEIIEYYKYVFVNEDIDVFCERCGLFGHYNGYKGCLFYNEKNENKIISRDATNAVKFIIDKIIDNDCAEKRKPLLCYLCKSNNKNGKCSNNSCGKCCGGCKIHKK